MTAFSVAFLTINERRDVRQDTFRDAGERACSSLDVSNSTIPTSEAKKQGKLVHAQGKLRAEIPGPKDVFLGVMSPNGLRIRRTVEMYQWVENRNEKEVTDAHGNKTTKVVYTYSGKWSGVAERCEHSFSHQNPHFPNMLIEGAGTGTKIIDSTKPLVLGESKTALDPVMVNLVIDFTPLPLDDAKYVEDPSRFAKIGETGLQIIPSRPNVLYSIGSSPEQPRVGDLRVKYEHVEEGPFTVVGRWTSDGTSSNGGTIHTFDEHLDEHELADVADIEGPEEAQRFAKRLGYKTFLIPEYMIEFAERTLLEIAPIRIAMVHRGFVNKTRAFDLMEDRDKETSTMLRFVGSFLCVFGCALALSPIAGLVPSAMGHMGSVGMGALIAKQTIDTARTQIGAEPVKDAATEFLSVISEKGSDDRRD